MNPLFCRHPLCEITDVYMRKEIFSGRLWPSRSCFICIMPSGGKVFLSQKKPAKKLGEKRGSHNCINTWRKCANMSELIYFQWCWVIGTRGTNLNTGGFLWTPGNIFLPWGWPSTGADWPEKWWILVLGDIQKPSWAPCGFAGPWEWFCDSEWGYFFRPV